MSNDTPTNAPRSVTGYQGDPFNCPTCGAHDFGLTAPWCKHCMTKENARLREELELIRAALTGDDYASLPSDLPTVRMAHTVRADHDKFRNQVRDTCHRAEQAEKELAEAKRDYTEKDRQYHMDAINRLASFLAMSGTSFEVVQAAIDNMTRLVAQKNLAIQSAKEWREQKQRADSYALDIEELQEQLRQLNAAYRTETQAKILSDACYENQYHRAEQAEARALAAEKDSLRLDWFLTTCGNHLGISDRNTPQEYRAKLDELMAGAKHD